MLLININQYLNIELHCNNDTEKSNVEQSRLQPSAHIIYLYSLHNT